MNTIFWTLLTALCSPILWLIASSRKIPEQRKILIIQWAKLGDMVCTTPMFRALKQAHPDWTVHVLCRAQSAVVLKNNPFIDRVIIGGSRLEMVTTLRRERYDTVINCLPGAFFSLLGLWCGAPVRINTPSLRHGLIIRCASVFNTINHPYEIGTSTFKHYLSLLAPLSVPAIPYGLDFFPSAEDKLAAQVWMDERRLTDHAFIILNVTAGNVVKEWPAEKFTAVANHITGALGQKVLLSTLDRSRAEQIRSQCSEQEKIVDGSSLTLGQLGVVCAKASAFVAVDTGPLYIAYAMKTPIVVLTGGSDVREQIPPAGERVIHVPPPAGCSPWMHVTLSPRTVTEQQRKCVQETSVDAVTHAVAKLM